MSKTNTNRLWSRRKLTELVSKRLNPILNSPYKKFNLSWFQVKRLKHAAKNKQYVHKFTKDLNIRFTDPQAFLHSVEELFIDEIYRFKPDNDHPRILDCGAHIGMSGLFFKHHYPGARITAFEPDTENYKIASQNFREWNLSGLEIVQKAVWIHNEQISFQQTHNMSSSIRAGNNHNEEEEKTSNQNLIVVPCVRLRDLLNEPIDFVKLDIEGAEYEVLMDCDETIRNVKNFFIEYHGKYEDSHKLSEIFSLLTRNGFVYYIKEAAEVYRMPFYETVREHDFDVQLNIFCMRKP